jgi:hypothetical protein
MRFSAGTYATIVAIISGVLRCGDLAAQASIACNVKSTSSSVTRVQGSAALVDAVRRIARTTYPGKPTAFAVEFQRICAGLRSWDSDSALSLNLVYGIAYQGIVDEVVVFAVGGRMVVNLNPTPGESLVLGLDTTSWNRFMRAKARTRLSNAHSATALACIVRALAAGRFPENTCSGEPSSVSYAAGIWFVRVGQKAIQLRPDGSISSLGRY